MDKIYKRESDLARRENKFKNDEASHSKMSGIEEALTQKEEALSKREEDINRKQEEQLTLHQIREMHKVNNEDMRLYKNQIQSLKAELNAKHEQITQLDDELKEKDKKLKDNDHHIQVADKKLDEITKKEEGLKVM